MGDMSMRSSYPPPPLPFLFGGQQTAPISRPGIFLRGPTKKQRLIQLPATFEDLVNKAANVFGIDRAANDIVIVLADDELTEIEEDSLPVLHEREVLLVKAIPRQPDDDTAMQIADPPVPIAGPSRPSTITLPLRTSTTLASIPIPRTSAPPLPPLAPSALALELHPAPRPGTAAVAEEDDDDQGFLAPPSSLEIQPHRRLSLTPLASAMKVKTCPMQAQNAAGSSLVQVHTSLNSAIGRAAPLTRSTSSAGVASGSSPLLNKRKAEHTGNDAGASNVPARRKRDVRKERKKHAEQTIARERAAMEAEAAAASVAADPHMQDPGLSGSGTPTGSQSRRRIAFDLPEDSSDDEAGATASHNESEFDELRAKEEQAPKAGSSVDTCWGLEDDSDESAESPAKRRKLSVEATQAARMKTVPLPTEEQPPPPAPAPVPLPEEAPQESTETPAAAPILTLSEAGPETSVASPVEVVPVEPASELTPKAHVPVTRSKTGRIQMPQSDRSPYLEISSSSSSSSSDSEEEGISSVCPARKSFGSEGPTPASTFNSSRPNAAAAAAAAAAATTATAPITTQSPPKIELPRGRPPVQPEKRAEYERMKEEIRRTMGKSPRKAGPRSRVRSDSQSPRLDKLDSDTPTNSQAASAVEDESPARFKRAKMGSARSMAPSPVPGRPHAPSDDVVHETPPGSPIANDTSPIAVVIPPVQMTAFKGPLAVQTPPPSVSKLPKKAPASKGGTGISPVMDSASQSAQSAQSAASSLPSPACLPDLFTLDDHMPHSPADSLMEVDDLTASAAPAEPSARTPESGKEKTPTGALAVKARSSLSPDDALKRYSANLMMAAASNDAHRAITAIQTAHKAASRSPSPAFARSNSTSPVAEREAKVTSTPQAQQESTPVSQTQAKPTPAEEPSQVARSKPAVESASVTVEEVGFSVAPSSNGRGPVLDAVAKGPTKGRSSVPGYGLVVPKSNPGPRAGPRHSTGSQAASGGANSATGARLTKASPAPSKLDLAYKTATALIESIFKHPSNEFIKPAAAKDLASFLHGHPEGSLNLVTVRHRIQARDFHGAKYAKTGTENDPLANLEVDLDRMWANMSSFFGPGSKQAKNVGELSKFTKGIFREWTLAEKRALKNNGGAEFSSSPGPSKGRTSGISTPGHHGSDAQRKANGTASGPGSRSNTPTQVLESNGKRTGRSGGGSGRSTPILDAKAIQNAARNGGQLPSALGLTSSSLTAHQKSLGGAPLRVRGTGSSSSSDSASGSPAFQSWLAKNMPANKAGGPASQAGSGGKGSVAAAEGEDAGMPGSSPVSSRQAATMPWFNSAGKPMASGATTIPASIPAPAAAASATNGNPSSLLNAFTGVLKSVTQSGSGSGGTGGGSK
ncbi:hypothetical protein OC861_005788 [Tilletia horrida]|nr:hypothetical protein OC861_005788 [Tilletia horrida]